MAAPQRARRAGGKRRALFGALLLLATAAETAAVEPATKTAWYKVQAIWYLHLGTVMNCFVLEYAFPGRWLNRRNLTLLALPSLLVLLLVIVNELPFM